MRAASEKMLWWRQWARQDAMTWCRISPDSVSVPGTRKMYSKTLLVTWRGWSRWIALSTAAGSGANTGHDTLP